MAVCSLWHCPAGHPGLLLATTLPCGVRTFLDEPSWGSTRPPGRLFRVTRVPPAADPAPRGLRCRGATYETATAVRPHALLGVVRMTAHGAIMFVAGVWSGYAVLG